MKTKLFIKKNLANFITFLRIIFSFTFLFFKFLSPLFFIFYTLAGLTDAFDGFVARTTKTTSKFGSKLDSISDLIFFVCLFIKLIFNTFVDWRIYLVIAFIAIVKVVILIIGFKKTSKLFVCHNVMNKVTGVIIFLIPFLLLLNWKSEIIYQIASSFALLGSFIEFIQMMENNAQLIE